MTSSASPPIEQEPRATARPVPTADKLLALSVGSVVTRLQRQYRADVASASAALARLRRAVTAAPGSIPEVWQDTIGSLPPQLLGHGDEPSWHESAAHAAVTLFALHQQSQRDRDMHVPGRTLGTAAAALRDAKRVDPDTALDPVTRRFLALSTSSTPAETLHHLRGFVAQLRDERVPVDYGRLAVDLRRLRSPRGALTVRLQWGRDFARRRPAFDQPQIGEQ